MSKEPDLHYEAKFQEELPTWFEKPNTGIFFTKINNKDKTKYPVIKIDRLGECLATGQLSNGQLVGMLLIIKSDGKTKQGYIIDNDDQVMLPLASENYLLSHYQRVEDSDEKYTF